MLFSSVVTLHFVLHIDSYYKTRMKTPIRRKAQRNHGWTNEQSELHCICSVIIKRKHKQYRIKKPLNKYTNLLFCSMTDRLTVKGDFTLGKG